MSARRVRIVVGEGRSSRQGMLRFVLAGEGYDVVADASNPAELARVLAVHKPDVVVLDDGIGATTVTMVHDMLPGAKMILVWPEAVSPIAGASRVEPSQVLQDLGPTVERLTGVAGVAVAGEGPAAVDRAKGDPSSLRRMLRTAGVVDLVARSRASHPTGEPAAASAAAEPIIDDREPAPVVILPVAASVDEDGLVQVPDADGGSADDDDDQRSGAAPWLPEQQRQRRWRLPWRRAVWRRPLRRRPARPAQGPKASPPARPAPPRPRPLEERRPAWPRSAPRACSIAGWATSRWPAPPWRARWCSRWHWAVPAYPWPTCGARPSPSRSRTNPRSPAGNPQRNGHRSRRWTPASHGNGTGGEPGGGGTFYPIQPFAAAAIPLNAIFPANDGPPDLGVDPTIANPGTNGGPNNAHDPNHGNANHGNNHGTKHHGGPKHAHGTTTQKHADRTPGHSGEHNPHGGPPGLSGNGHGQGGEHSNAGGNGHGNANGHGNGNGHGQGNGHGNGNGNGNGNGQSHEHGHGS